MITCKDEEEMIDKHLGMELTMDVGTNNERGAALYKGLLLMMVRQLIGTAHSNPVLDTRACEIEFLQTVRGTMLLPTLLLRT